MSITKCNNINKGNISLQIRLAKLNNKLKYKLQVDLGEIIDIIIQSIKRLNKNKKIYSLLIYKVKVYYSENMLLSNQNII